MKTLLIECVDGVPRRVKTMSLNKREEFASLCADLGFYLKQIYDDESKRAHTYRSLYDSDEKFRGYCRQLLELGNVNPDWIDIDLRVRLLFPHQDEDDRFHKRGALLEFNYEDTGKQSVAGDAMSYEELLAMIWNSADSLMAAMDAAENTPVDVIINAIIAKCEQMKTPEQRLKDASKKKALEDVDAIQSGKMVLLDLDELGEEVDL